MSKRRRHSSKRGRLSLVTAHHWHSISPKTRCHLCGRPGRRYIHKSTCSEFLVSSSLLSYWKGLSSFFPHSLQPVKCSVVTRVSYVSFLLDSRLSAFVASEHWMAALLPNGSLIRKNGTKLILDSTAVPGGATLILAQDTRAPRGERETGVRLDIYEALMSANQVWCKESTAQNNITTYVFKVT